MSVNLTAHGSGVREIGRFRVGKKGSKVGK